MSPFPIEPARAQGPMRFVVTTYPDREAALAAVDAVLASKLAACANVLDVHSRFWWRGSVEASDEALVVFKTVPKRVGALFHFLEMTHPYAVPEVAEVDIPRVGNAYLRYLAQTLDPASPPPPLGGGARRRAAPRGREARAPRRTRARHHRRSR